jgi:hypothetical protein
VLGIIVEEGIACTKAVGLPEDLDTREGVRDVLDDGLLVHKLQRLVHGGAVGPQLSVARSRLSHALCVRAKRLLGWRTRLVGS